MDIRMDTFTDKLAQKRNAQGLINANAAADAAKMEMLQHQVNEYEMLLQEMRKVNLRTAENAEQVQKALQAGIQKIEAFQKDDNAQAATKEVLSDMRKQTEELLAEMKKQMEESFKHSDDYLHKECVKVYRNVQASMSEELEKQAAAIAAKQKENDKKNKAAMPISIIIMLLVVVDILVNLFNIIIPM